MSVQYLRARQTQSSVPPVKIGEIARCQNIPQKFLELILAGLKQSGLVDSRRGTEGVYFLARSPDKMTIGDVLRAGESDKGLAREEHDGPFGDLWKRVRTAVSAVLDETTFTILARDWQDRQTEYVLNWDI